VIYYYYRNPIFEGEIGTVPPFPFFQFFLILLEIRLPYPDFDENRQNMIYF